MSRGSPSRLSASALSVALVYRWVSAGLCEASHGSHKIRNGAAGLAAYNPDSNDWKSRESCRQLAREIIGSGRRGGFHGARQGERQNPI